LSEGLAILTFMSPATPLHAQTLARPGGPAAGPKSSFGPPARPYASEWDYLEDWFQHVSSALAPRQEKENVDSPAPEPTPVQELTRRTEASLEAGIGLPFESYVREKKLDPTDRGLLLAFLYDSLNPLSGGGLTTAQLFAVCDARSMAEQAEVRLRLEERGALRSLELIECDMDFNPGKRFYRLARWGRSVLLAPPSHAEPLTDAALLERFDDAAERFCRRLTRSYDIDGPRWCAPNPQGGGWSGYRAQARALRAAVDQIRRHGTSSMADALRGYGFSPQEEAVFAALVFEARTTAKGVAVGFLLTFAEKYTDARVTFEELAGPRSKLVENELVEIDSAGPLFLRLVRFKDEAVEQLLPGMCNSLEKKPETDSDEKPVAFERIEPKTKLVNAVLPPEVFEELSEVLMAARSFRGSFESWGLHSGSHEGNGFILLFEGPPGTGKTYTAEAVAHSLGRPLFRARLDQVFSKWVGQTEKAIATLFREAEEEGAVVLFDEADALLGVRDDKLLGFQVTQVNVLLQELERFSGVTILTTNRPHALDPALERRLAARLVFTPPGPKERERLWRVHLPSKAAVARDIDFAALGGRYDFNGSQIRLACVRAARAAFRRLGNDQVIRQSDLEAAARKVTAKGSGPVLGFRLPARTRKEAVQ
jgi:hypothetical protein